LPEHTLDIYFLQIQVVFPAAQINFKSRLEVRERTAPTAAAAAEDDDDDDDRLAAGDATLIVEAQKGFAKKLEAARLRQIQTLYEKTGVNLNIPPAWAVPPPTKGKQSASAAPTLTAAAPTASTKTETRNTLIRFIFPERVAVQVMFHPKEPITAVFDFARALVVDPTAPFHLFVRGIYCFALAFSRAPCVHPFISLSLSLSFSSVFFLSVPMHLHLCLTHIAPLKISFF
jgi:hypothetical protein